MAKTKTKATPAATNTLRLTRFLRAPPSRVYKALIDPDAMVKWLPPHGFTGKVHSLDPRVGGSWRMSFTNLGTGLSHSFGGSYLELKPYERIVHTDRFDDPDLPAEMRTTFQLREVLCGTELSVVMEGLTAAMPIEFAYLGWQDSLDLLKSLVEPEIRSGVAPV